MLKKTDAALAKADSEGTIDVKALAIKLAVMTGVAVAGVAGTLLVQNAIKSNDKDPE